MSGEWLGGKRSGCGCRGGGWEVLRGGVGVDVGGEGWEVLRGGVGVDVGGRGLGGR